MSEKSSRRNHSWLTEQPILEHRGRGGVTEEQAARMLAGETVSVDPIKFLDLDPRRPLQWQPGTARHFVEHLDEYDLIGWACELVGFDRKDVGAVHAWFDFTHDYVVLEVALMDEWVPDYTIPVNELVDGRAPMPSLLNAE